MSPSELENLAIRIFGRTWRGPLSHVLKVQARTIQRWMSGEQTIPPSVADQIRQEATRAPSAPEWIIGEGPEAGYGTWLVHTRPPLFFGRLALPDEEANFLDGVTYGFRTGETLCEISWLQPPPADEPSLLRLLQEAETAVEIWSLESDGLDEG